MFLYLFLLLSCPFSFIFSWQEEEIAELAYITVPVADATLRPLQLLDLTKSAEQLYKELPFSGEKGQYACSRFHQLLFNEIVRVKTAFKDEIECELLNVFYESPQGKKHKTVWLLKKNIKLLSAIPKKNLSAVPQAYTQDLKKSLDNILTLTWPWQDSVLQVTYSAGTRFVRASHLDTAQVYGICLVDPVSGEIKFSRVPHRLARVSYPTDQTQAINLFVSLLKKWATQTSLIPYVWGGCSFVQTYKTNVFSLREGYRCGEKTFYWNRPGHSVPITGLECSGLIFRIAQICGMPYYFKNTTAIGNNLHRLQKTEVLAEGDLIWYLGHVLIVSNLKENRVVQAVGYLTGLGKVHESPISQVFKNINTLEDLTRAYFGHNSLERLDVAGRVMRSIYEFRLLKMSSIWR